MKYSLCLFVLLLSACGVDGGGVDQMDDAAALPMGGAAATTVGQMPDRQPTGVAGAAGQPLMGGAAGGAAGGIGGTDALEGGAGGTVADPGRPLGDACINDDQCASNVCLNNRCCERRCDTDCESCAAATGKCVAAPNNTPCGDVGPHCKRDSALACAPGNPNPACQSVSQMWWETNPYFLVTPQCQAGKCEEVETNCREAFGVGQIGFCGQLLPADTAMCHPA